MLNKLSIVCWNVHLTTFAKGNQYVVDQLESLNSPDIICLQEYVQGTDSTTLDWLTKHGYELTYLPFANFPYDQSISQGVLTAVKHSVVSSSRPITLRKDGPRRFRQFTNIRGCIETVVSIEGIGEITVLNLHSTFARHYTVDMRQREFEKLISHIDKLPKSSRLFICGDFNFFGRDSRRNYMKKRFNYFTRTVLNKTWKHSVPLSPIRANIDYFFWNKDKLNVMPDMLPFSKSDHRPLIATLELV